MYYWLLASRVVSMSFRRKRLNQAVIDSPSRLIQTLKDYWKNVVSIIWASTCEHPEPGADRYAAIHQLNRCKGQYRAIDRSPKDFG